ncbi:DUF3300 domain-containing protein [Pseudaminobacter soli (ex Li et al. 2025)]|uniref:DUF3300 domain-containing protein n=1 Tax=Pseudaminobacter soli (ex Li et al. 2025) TaxID=1295366 RepID=A0A2P7S374_9HYPH|nr:DUF3300 domain-containing protein [Mesorhizobium soli]PSJ56918.1 DUF3300 domain-containing protein [Mesorhizobium soli]
MTRWGLILAAVSLVLAAGTISLSATYAQEQTGAANAPTAGTSAPTPLTEHELQVLVAPIALYPDELIAVISQASLYPLQVVEADRYLGQYAKDKKLKPKASWDESVISLLNYPDIVKKMSSDLEWTQKLGDAIANQQKDVLVAIQQLRHEAVAKDIIKSDDKIKVSEENAKVVIQSASPDQVYVPQYEPQMLYVADYPPEPISYYPEPYPDYWYPTAPFYAAALTGAAWAAAIDWNDWGIWGGRWNGDVDIDCNHCFKNRDFNGKVNLNDVDWRNVDRSKININQDQFAKFNQSNVRNSLERNSANDLRNRTASIKNERRSAKTAKAGNVGKSTLEGLKNQPGRNTASANKPNANKPNVNKANINKPNVNKPNAKNVSAKKANPNKANARKPNVKTAANVDRPSGKGKSAGKAHNRPQKPSNVASARHGKIQNGASNRGAYAMGAGSHGRHGTNAHRPRRHMAGPGGGGGFRGGGGRGGGGRRR